MLSNNPSFRKLNVLAGKRSKLESITNNPNGSVSIDDLAFLVKRLSVQIGDLETWKEKSSEPQEPPLPPLPQQQQQQQQHIPIHTTVDPWASYVPQNYGALLQRLQDMANLQKCPNQCCANTGTVSSADGVPWPNPIEPFQTAACESSSQPSLNDMLDTQYTHWCTLMRCLPLMDPITCEHVKTVGLYALREILKLKANQKRDFLDPHHPPVQRRQQHQHQQQACCCRSTTATSTKLRDSLSCLGNVVPPVMTTTSSTTTTTTSTPANQDMPAWMSTSETKTAIADILTPTIIPPKETDTTTTPIPSSFSSPTLLTGKRFQRWIKQKKSQRKVHTDTASTPMTQSQTLRKISSWLF